MAAKLQFTDPVGLGKGEGYTWEELIALGSGNRIQFVCGLGVGGRWEKERSDRREGMEEMEGESLRQLAWGSILGVVWKPSVVETSGIHEGDPSEDTRGGVYGL